MPLTIGSGWTLGPGWVGGGDAGPAAANDLYFMYNSLLLTGDGTNNATNNTFLDSSTNNFAITRAGNTTQGSFSPYGANWSLSNPNTSDNGIGVASNAALNLGTASFTVECWVNLNALPSSNGWTTSAGGYQALFGTGPSNSSTGSQLYIGTTNLFFDTTSDGSGPISVAHGMTAGVWYHIALTRSGNTFALYKNGVLLQSASNASSMTSGYGWGIARPEPVGSWSGGWLNGYISNFRLVTGSVVYAGAFTPPTAPLTAISGTQLLLCQSNRWIDNSSNSFAVSVGSTAPTIQRFSPFSPTAAYSAGTIGGSGYFDGSGDYLSLTTTAFQHTGDFTYECWVYWNGTVPSDWPVIFDTRPANTSQNSSIAVCINPSTYRLNFYLDGTNYYWGATGLPSNQWVHIACVRSSGVVKIYQNGVAGTDTRANSNTFSGATVLRIGANIGNMGWWPGYISNFRVTNTAVYTSSFTPPTAPVTAISGTSLLTNFTNGGITDSAMITNLETVGDAKISTTQSKFGGSSMAFDGSGDYLAEPTNVNFGYGTGNFTIEFWLYLNATSAQSIVSNLTTASSVNPHIYYSPTNGITYYVASVDRIIGGALSTSTWYHIALSRSSTSTKLFVNGTQVGSTYTDSNNYGTTAPLAVATYWESGTPSTVNTLNGYIDDLRVTKGYARYTTTFTPPTAALPTY